MILTQKVLDAVGACAAGCELAKQLNCIDIDLALGIQIMEQHHPEYATWARGLYKSRIALKAANYYEYIQYLVFDHVNNHFKATPDELHAHAIKQEIIKWTPETDHSKIVIYEEIKSLDGSIYRFLLD
jgi:hypothetical protein